MTALTLALALLGSVAAWRLRPSRALVVYCAGLFLYPQALTIQVGGADFSLGRLLILAVLANAIIRGQRYRAFEWSWMDTLLSASYGLGFIALLQTAGAVALERHTCAFFDTLLPYFAARLIITEEEDFVTFAKGLAIIAVPLVALGVYQMLTGQNPIGDLSAYYRLGRQGMRAEDGVSRLGFYRAAVTFTHPIAFGLFCAMVAPLAVSLWQQTWPRRYVLALAAVACGGVFVSLSSGPWLSLACTALALVAYVRWRVAVRLVAYSAMFVLGCAWYVGSYSDVLAAFAFKPWNALYRVGLIGEALGGGMSGHWLTGYGYVGLGPGNDNSYFHWLHRDLVNLYIQLLVRTGLLGLTPYLLANGLYYVRLIQAIRMPVPPRATWLAVSMLAAMLGWNAAMLSVGALSQVMQLLYMAIAMSANMPSIVASAGRRGQ